MFITQLVFDNMHRILLTREKIKRKTQIKIRVLIKDTLMDVNHRIRPHIVRLRDLHDTSDDSASSGSISLLEQHSISCGSTSSPEQGNDELSVIQQAPNEPPPPVNVKEYVKSEPDDDYILADLSKGTPEF